jgi:hypothetical protein
MPTQILLDDQIYYTTDLPKQKRQSTPITPNAPRKMESPSNYANHTYQKAAYMALSGCVFHAVFLSVSSH